MKHIPEQLLTPLRNREAAPGDRSPGTGSLSMPGSLLAPSIDTRASSGLTPHTTGAAGPQAAGPHSPGALRLSLPLQQ